VTASHLSLATFESRLRVVCLERPCAVLPNALWKTLGALRRMVDPVLLSDLDSETGEVRSLHARDSDRLMVHWGRSAPPPLPDRGWMAGYRLALVHERYILNGHFPLEGASSVSRYFRLVHRGPAVAGGLPSGLAFRDVDGRREVAEVAAFINRCYEGVALRPETVGAWLDHPTVALDLWVWVVEPETDAPVGLGIAELDPTVPEASLEWVQVLPAYRRQGVGTALVSELLRRVAGRVAFTTVSGELDNVTNPEALYRRCGFTGDDVWWVLRR
jgi:GNAT superfamily N-acetyltransferase